MSVYLDIKSLYPHLKVNWNVLMCKICIARRLVVDIFPWCNANFVPSPSGTLVACRMGNGSIQQQLHGLWFFQNSTSFDCQSVVSLSACFVHQWWHKIFWLTSERGDAEDALSGNSLSFPEEVFAALVDGTCCWVGCGVAIIIGFWRGAGKSDRQDIKDTEQHYCDLQSYGILLHSYCTCKFTEVTALLIWSIFAVTL